MPQPATPAGPTLVLGVVVDGPHLTELLASVDAQTAPAQRIRTVLVDVGDDPAAGAVARSWVEERKERAMLLTGPTTRLAAMNAVLEWAASGPWDRQTTWVTFPDAGDVLDPAYVATVSAAIAEHGPVAAVVGRRLLWDAATGGTKPVPLLDAPFRDGGTAVVDLTSQPEDPPTTVRSAFLRLGDLLAAGLRFDERLEAGFGEQDLILRYLSRAERAVCLYVDAVYRSRVQPDDPTGVREPFTRRAKFTDVLRHGHLELLSSFGGRGAAPAFVQHAVLLDLGWYFRADEALTGQMNAEMHHVQDEYHGLVAQILALLDPVLVDAVEPARMPPDRHAVLAHGYCGESWHEEWVTLEAQDRRRGLVRLSYRYTGALPAERVLLDGRPVSPRYAKSRAIVYAGRTLAHQRLLWVASSGSVAIELDGRLVPMTRPRLVPRRAVLSPRAVLDAMSPRRTAAQVAANGPGAILRRIFSSERWVGWFVRYLAALGPVRRRYGGSWVLMDRVESGHDNAEHLFAHLQRSEPSIRSWFAVERGSKDWRRLKRQGFKNVLAYGSLRWMLVCLNATHVISSQAGPYVYDPKVLRPIRRPSWRFVFLQHGVIATDLHRWLNQRTFDLFVTTTSDEFAAVAGDESEYRFTPHEVALTGLPRHDRLVRLDAELPREKRHRILVLPTWREYLLGPTIDGKGRRPLRDDFAETLYARAWFGLLRSERLKKLASDHGATIAFMPHPNVQPYLERFELPSHVETLTYADNDIQEVLTSAKVVVTDFSSIVFDAAYIGRPVVYYQFDQAEAFGGRHTVRQGYFSYEDDGFGPVVRREDEVIEALGTIAAAGFEASPEHSVRRDHTFPVRDDNSSARVVAAIRELDQPLSRKEQTTAVELPRARPNQPTPRAEPATVDVV